jgi:hypothetical protein
VTARRAQAIPQARLYSSNAERQAAYRARLTDRLALAGTNEAVKRIRELEEALANAQRQAAAAEARADHADARRRRAETRQETASRRHAGPSQTEVDALLRVARERIAELEVVVGELSRRLAAAERRSPSEPSGQIAPGSSTLPAGPNRAERRRSERKERRSR